MIISSQYSYFWKWFFLREGKGKRLNTNYAISALLAIVTCEGHGRPFLPVPNTCFLFEWYSLLFPRPFPTLLSHLTSAGRGTGWEFQDKEHKPFIFSLFVAHPPAVNRSRLQRHELSLTTKCQLGFVVLSPHDINEGDIFISALISSCRVCGHTCLYVCVYTCVRACVYLWCCVWSMCFVCGCTRVSM